MNTIPAAAVAVLLVAGSVGCGLTDDGGARADSGGPLSVAAAFYPLQFVTERVGAERVSVTNLTKPGAEPHDVELKPSQVEQIESAALVVYLRGFQPAVDDAVPAGRALDAADAAPLEGGDPHFWLDPTRLAAVGDAVGQRLAEIDSAHATDYTARAADLRRELTALDTEYGDALGHCQRRQIVTSHEAFGYLARRYHLEQVGISGLDPESDPSPARIREVARFVREHGVRTIFFESLVSPKVAQTIADETGATAEALDPVEGVDNSSDADYFTVMRTNLAALRRALGCGGG